MKNFRFRSGIGLVFSLLFIFNIRLVVIAVITTDHLLVALGIVTTCVQYYLYERFGRSHNTLRQYPFKHWLKGLFSFLPEKISRLFIPIRLPNTELRKKERLLLALRSKRMETTIVQDNLLYEHDPGFEYLQTNPALLAQSQLNLRVEVGTSRCRHPYNMSVFNFGALDRGTVNKETVHAISQAANICHCSVSSGEKGLTPDLVRGGGDIIWQISYNDIEQRNPDRSFNESLMKIISLKPYVKMIEIRLYSIGDTNRSRTLNQWSVFALISKLRVWSDGKPVGMHLMNPSKEMIDQLIGSIASSGICLDFITIEESFAPNRLWNKAGEQRFFEAVFRAKTLFRSYGLQTIVIATGVILTEYEILRLCALSADACFSAAGSLLENGKFKQKFSFRSQSQSIWLANYQRNTISATWTLMQLCGYEKLSESDLADFFRRTNMLETRSLRDIFCQEEQKETVAACVHLN
jgi:hypothetical protein